MAFSDLSIPRTLDTSTHDLVKDFFVPLLGKAVRYDRGVGYFSSGWLRANTQGMVEFARKGGRARWITSPILSRTDWEYLQKGEAAKHDTILREALAQNIEDLGRTLERDTLSALAWLVADGILTFRLADPHTKLHDGDFHDKFGVFEDVDGNQVSFNGSYNDSIQGLRNYESLKVFRSWDQTAELVQSDVDRFRRLWTNDDPYVRVYELPEAARVQIIRLRSDERPYPEPEYGGFYAAGQGTPGISEPVIELWPHQKEAIEAWVDNDCVGLLNMATGSGKTVTALKAAAERPDLDLLIIAVPTKNLVDQWYEELRRFTDFPEPVLVYESSALWQDRLFKKLRAAHRIGWEKPVVIIGSMASLSGARFQSVISDAGIPEYTLLIVDEVHNVGAPTRQCILNPAFSMRLGLSATPERHYDEQGTQAIMANFGREVYAYTMKQALDEGRLSPYRYHVYAATLSQEEYDDYLKLTRRILSARGNSSSSESTLFTNNQLDGDTQEVEQLLFKRARILKKAASKMDILETLLEKHPFKRGLIYCADNEQLDEVHEILLELDVVHLKYTGETPKEKRRVALDSLASGQVPTILAIDCLDEGVDVPAVDTAIILANSTNERQFIQRRGRVLRRSPGKKYATLIDVIALPPPSVGPEGRWMLKGELVRAKKMAELAENRPEALLQIKAHTERYGVLLTNLMTNSTDAEEFIRESNTTVQQAPREGSD